MLKCIKKKINSFHLLALTAVNIFVSIFLRCFLCVCRKWQFPKTHTQRCDKVTVFSKLEFTVCLEASFL